MTEAKVELRVGEISFSGEGTEEWVSQQLDKALEWIPELAKVAPKLPSTNGSGTNTSDTGGQKVAGTLASFLKSKGATTNQVRKFLATATWLHDRDSKSRLTTKDVTGALSASSQSRLTNASDCLNQNVGKGFCEKDDKQFYVTEEGRLELA